MSKRLAEAFRERGVDFSLRFEGAVTVAAGKAWQREHETGGHTAGAVRKQGERDAGAQLTSSFSFSPGPKSIEQNHLHLGWGFSPQSTQARGPHGHAQRFVSSEMLDPGRLIGNIHHHGWIRRFQYWSTTAL